MAEIGYNVAASILLKLGSSAYEELGLATSMKKDLKKLKDKTLILQSVLGDAEKKQAKNEPLKNWLVRVKDVFHDAVDVLDEFDCEMLRREVVKEYGSIGKKVSRFFSRSNPIAFRFSIAHKVKEIRERLDEIVGDMAQFQLISAQLNVINEPGQLSDRMTHSYVNASEVIGRDDDKARIIEMLLREGGDGLSVIPIIGFGGLGKTTLAKSVYNDAKIVGKFDLKLWVCVSLDFEVNHLLREILREIKIEEDVGKMSIEQLQTSLRSKLERKRVFLVLDDVWNEDRNKWLELRQFLDVTAGGSKVIVTARSTNVSSIMTRTPPRELEGLSEADSLSLFNTYAFGDEIEATRHPNLRDIGTAIAKKCSGIPLVLKTLGSLLYSKPEAEWERVRDHKIWELEQVDGDILPALRLSYNTMSPCLKQCFAYCSTFLNDMEFQSIQAVSIWMALGILHSPNGKMELEDIGELQLQELLARSFLQYEDADSRDFVELPGLHIYASYKMHDLIHDLACSVTNDEFRIVKSGMDVVSNRVRHLRIKLDENNLTSVWSSKKLQSLYIDQTSELAVTESIFSACIARLKYLRVFDLENSSFEAIPSSVGTLKQLRYLSFSDCKHIKRLPDSICDLQSLQTLLLDGCDELQELPRGIKKLVSLRTLMLTTKQTYFPENGIGRLKSLRTLGISDCENLRSLSDDIKYCTTLRNLLLMECDKLELGCKYEEAIVELSLQCLFIRGLPEMKGFPRWLEGASKTLKLLSVVECHSLVELPKWLNVASLTNLWIGNCNQLNVESKLEVVQLNLQSFLISGFPETTGLPQWLQGANYTLKTLLIEDCPVLASLPEWLVEFTSLEKLRILNCRKLSSLPKGMSCLTSLRHLEVKFPSLAFYERYAPEIGTDWEAISHIPNIFIW